MRQINFKIPESVDILKRAINEDFKGYDPYDALNLPIINIFPCLKNKHSMIFLTQFFKNFPINLRPIFLIKKERNAKGIALFVSGILNIYDRKNNQKYLKLATILLDWLKNNKSAYRDSFAWGYNFPWQSRNSYKPKYYPNIVTTSFVAHSFLDSFVKTQVTEYLNVAKSAGSFILNELNIYKDERGICFSYSPTDNEKIYNANILGAWLLIRLWKYTGSENFLDYGKRALKFVLESQNKDGSWFYGDNQNQRWIDNFHTGYNLWTLKEISNLIDFNGLPKCIKKGLDYYIENLFDNKFLPTYYNNKKYPLDIHSFAVSIIVFLKYGKIKEATQILKEACKLLYSGRGYFYYRKNSFLVNKINYIRWANAWMFYALTEIEKYENMG